MNGHAEVSNFQEQMTPHKGVTLLSISLVRGTNNSFIYDKEVSEEEALVIQQQAGFHPAGYSFFNYRVENGQTKWSCYGSCE